VVLSGFWTSTPWRGCGGSEPHSGYARSFTDCCEGKPSAY